MFGNLRARQGLRKRREERGGVHDFTHKLTDKLFRSQHATIPHGIPLWVLATPH